MRFSSKTALKDTSIQMTSMIDVVFLLLVFFMCVTEMNRLEAESLTLPIAYKARDDSNPPPGRITVNIVRAGSEWEIHVKKQKYDLKMLATLIRNEAVARTAPDGTSEMAVKIRADADCPYKYVQKVMFVCSENRVWRVSFGVQPRDNTTTERGPEV